MTALPAIATSGPAPAVTATSLAHGAVEPGLRTTSSRRTASIGPRLAARLPTPRAPTVATWP